MNSERLRIVRGLDVFSFDLAGRPLFWTLRGVTYRRGLDGRIKEIRRQDCEGEKFHETRLLDPQEAAKALGEVRRVLAQAAQETGHELCARALELDLNQDAARFRSIYSPVAILPPDQYRALVLQLALGCSYNQCSFCTFYKGVPYRVRPLAEFAVHVQQALDYMGPALSWRRGLFLGDANAANLPFEVLAEALEYLARVFPRTLRDAEGRPRHPLGFEQVASFLDTFSQLRRSVSEWKSLRELGLESLSLGVESGSLEVLKLLRKPGAPDHVEELVVRLKEAGVRVSVIVLAGIGGRLAGEHVSRTAALLNRLPLGPRDRVYVSELVCEPGSDYPRLAAAAGIPVMDRLECRRQSRALRAALELPPYPEGPAVSPYDVRQFLY